MEETRKDNRKDDTPVVNQIIIKAPLRKVSDVGTWRAALRAADAGRPASLYNLFEDIMIDGLLSDAVQKRIDAVTNAELTFQDASGEEVQEISDLMDSTAWETLLTEIIKCKMYGRSGIELTFRSGRDIRFRDTGKAHRSAHQINPDPGERPFRDTV